MYLPEDAYNFNTDLKSEKSIKKNKNKHKTAGLSLLTTSVSAELRKVLSSETLNKSILTDTSFISLTQWCKLMFIKYCDCLTAISELDISLGISF